MEFRVCGLAVLATLLAAFSYGQITTGSILGVVADDSGARIPGATVTVTNLETGIARTLTTDPSGRYRAVNFALGQYEVKAEVAGFRAAVRQGIQMTVGSEAVALPQSIVGGQPISHSRKSANARFGVDENC